jgi:two-component system sensor histidine kinase DesK
VLPAVSDPGTQVGRDDAESRHARLIHSVIYLFLLSLAGCASDVADGKADPRWLSGAALAVFVACFVVFVETHPHTMTAEGSLSTTRGSGWLRGGVLIVLASIAIGTTLAYGTDWMVLFIFVVVTFVASLPPRYAAASIAGSAVCAVVVNIAAQRNATTVITGASWALSIVMAGSIALLLRRRGILVEELRGTRDEVARLAAADAVADERLRFARDLHDLLGHSLSVIVLKAELAGRLLEREGASGAALAEVADVEDIARRALEEVREAVTGYRARSLRAELERTRDALGAAGVEVRVEMLDEPLPPDLEALLARVLREATTNIVRHSRATHAAVRLTHAGGDVRLEVSDDGVGPGPADAGAGHGLSGLAEAVADAGGRFEAGPGRPAGFRLVVELPCGREPAHDGEAAPFDAAADGAASAAVTETATADGAPLADAPPGGATAIGAAGGRS